MAESINGVSFEILRDEHGGAIGVVVRALPPGVALYYKRGDEGISVRYEYRAEEEANKMANIPRYAAAVTEEYRGMVIQAKRDAFRKPDAQYAVMIHLAPPLADPPTYTLKSGYKSLDEAMQAARDMIDDALDKNTRTQNSAP